MSLSVALSPSTVHSPFFSYSLVLFKNVIKHNTATNLSGFLERNETRTKYLFILSVFEDLISPNTKWFKTSILLLCSYYTHLTHFIINCSLLINTPFQKKEILSENYSLDAAFFFRFMMLLNISQLTCYISSTCILGLQHLPKRVLIYRDYFEF